MVPVRGALPEALSRKDRGLTGGGVSRYLTSMMTRGELFPARNAVQADLERLMAIQEAAYGAAFIESIGSFSRRIAAAPDSIWVAEVAVAGGTPVPVGYLFTYRSVYGKVTPLGGEFEISPQADTLYLHDLALIPAYRGHGIAGALVDS